MRIGKRQFFLKNQDIYPLIAKSLKHQVSATLRIRYHITIP